MNSEKNLQVIELLETTKKTGPEMTHALAELGDGRMSEGLMALWKNGQRNGIIRGATGTTLLFTAGIGIYVLAKNKVEENRTKRAIVENLKETSVPTSLNTTKTEPVVEDY